MATALSHRALNPAGHEINIPAWVLARLGQLKLLQWNHTARCHQITSAYFDLLPLLATDTYSHKPLRALDLSAVNAHASGKPSRILAILGTGCTGPNVAICNCKHCNDLASETDHTRAPADNARESLART